MYLSSYCFPIKVLRVLMMFYWFSESEIYFVFITIMCMSVSVSVCSLVCVRACACICVYVFPCVYMNVRVFVADYVCARTPKCFLHLWHTALISIFLMVNRHSGRFVIISYWNMSNIYVLSLYLGGTYPIYHHSIC